jgi:precorrin-6A/cobalt-precorrin-6A reductase
MIGPPGPDCATEMAMMREKGITHMIAKNAGGRAGYAKMEAARALQLPVFVLARPQAPDAQVTQDVDAAIAWGRTHAL